MIEKFQSNRVSGTGRKLQEIHKAKPRDRNCGNCRLRMGTHEWRCPVRGVEVDTSMVCDDEYHPGLM